MNEHREQRPIAMEGPTSGSKVPTRLVERPRARLGWFGGFTAVGIAVIVVGVLSAAPPDDLWVPIVSFGLGAGSIALGAVALRWSIVADRVGVTVTNVRRRTIAWTELEDVLLVKVESDIDLGFHHLLFVTHTGEAIRPAAPTGWNRRAPAPTPAGRAGGDAGQLRVGLAVLNRPRSAAPASTRAWQEAPHVIRFRVVCE